MSCDSMTSTAVKRFPEFKQKNRFMSSQIPMKQCQALCMLSNRLNFEILDVFSSIVAAMEFALFLHTSWKGIRSKTAFICVTVALLNT